MYCALLLIIFSFVCTAKYDPDGTDTYDEEINKRIPDVNTEVLENPKPDPPVEPQLYHNAERVYAIADLHGDYEAAVEALELAYLIDDDLNWIGGKDILVQTGDIVDRGPDSRKIYDLFKKITNQADAAGGKVLQLLGNHEVMNFMGRLHYVPDSDFSAYGGFDARQQLWSTEGSYGKYLRKLPLTVVVNETLFAHAGIEISFAKRGLENLNRLTYDILTKHNNEGRLTYEQLNLLQGHNCPVWTRNFDPEFSGKGLKFVCRMVKKTLNFLGLKRMVIGHNVQMDLAPKKLCGGKLYSMDVGMSKHYGGGMSVWHHSGEGITMLRRGDIHRPDRKKELGEKEEL